MNIYLTSSIDKVAKDIAGKLAIKKPKLLFVATAAEPIENNESWLSSNRSSLVNAGFDVVDFTFTDKSKAEVAQALKDIDILYVGGGNVMYLLQQIQQSKSADLIKQFVNSGKVYIGSSAGSVVAGPSIYQSVIKKSAEFAPKLNGHDGLGLANFTIFPHWGRPDFKPVYFGERLMHAWDSDAKVILLNDSQYVETDGKTFRIVEV